VPKGDGKRCSRSHSRTVMIAYHQIQSGRGLSYRSQY